MLQYDFFIKYRFNQAPMIKFNQTPMIVLYISFTKIEIKNATILFIKHNLLNIRVIIKQNYYGCLVISLLLILILFLSRPSQDC